MDGNPDSLRGIIMKSNRSQTSHQSAKRATVAYIFLLAAVLAAATLWPSRVGAVFMDGPSVRVNPNSKIEIRWTADFVGDGKVEVFDNANGGTPIDVKTTPIKNTEHTVEFSIGGVIKADTNYFLKFTHSDPTGDSLSHTRKVRVSSQQCQQRRS